MKVKFRYIFIVLICSSCVSQHTRFSQKLKSDSDSAFNNSLNPNCRCYKAQKKAEREYKKSNKSIKKTDFASNNTKNDRKLIEEGVIRAKFRQKNRFLKQLSHSKSVRKIKKERGKRHLIKEKRLSKCYLF
jgi:hypothetical protein